MGSEGAAGTGTTPQGARRSPVRHRWAAVAVAAAVLAALALVVPAGTSAASGAAPATTATTAVVARERLTERTVRLTLTTPSFARQVAVEVTLPVGYEQQPQRRWPVTYYLHGTNHGESAFRAEYHGEEVTAGFASIVVSPDGDSGYWSDWPASPIGQAPAYETFVTRELIPLVDSIFRTDAQRSQRAVMGESMGGFGALALAARHPDLFAATASLSGSVDSNHPLAATVITASPVLMGAAPDAIFGPRLTQEVVWRGHNPWDLAANLRPLEVALFTGSGVHDAREGETVTDLAGCTLESGIIRPTSTSVHDRLTALGVAHRWEPLPWGCHSVALFDAEMRSAVAWLAGVFAAPRPEPESVDHRSIEAAFDVFSWSVRADPARATEFLELVGASRPGLTLRGSGATTVTTPAWFAGRGTVLVTVDGRSRPVPVDDAGRITFVVDLGPPGTRPQLSPGTTTRVVTAHVLLD